MKPGLAERRTVRIPDDEITWAGECPWTGNYCLGAMSGKVLFLGDSGHLHEAASSETLAVDAINGIAFWNEFIGVSTRSEVVVYRRVPNGFDLVYSGPGGAHCIVATTTGQFLAPMWIYGLLCVDLTPKGGPRGWTASAAGALLNFYMLAPLGEHAKKEVLACAGRNDGLFRIQLDAANTKSDITRLTAPDVDFVDVCALDRVRQPCAVAALCRDGSVVIVRNLLMDVQLQMIRIEGIQGTPYAIRAAMGHLFVLTSEQLTLIPDFASWYFDGERSDRLLHYRQMSVQADDVFIANEKELLLLTVEGLEIESIQRLAGSCADSIRVATESDALCWTDNECIPEISHSPAEWMPAPAGA